LLTANARDVRLRAGLARNRATAAELERRSGHLEEGRKRIDEAIAEIQRLGDQYETTDLERERDWMIRIRGRFPR
jgi:hypothetical protein